MFFQLVLVALILRVIGSPHKSREEYVPITRSGTIGNIVVGITTFRGRQDHTIPAIKNTWGSDFEHVYAFSGYKSSIIDFVVTTKPELARATWEEMELLSVLAKQFPEAPWYFKSDDDAYVNTVNLAELIQNYNPDENWYIGKKLFFDYQNYSQYYCLGGCGYLISNKLMKLISSKVLSDEMYSDSSDVHIGHIIESVVPGINHSDVCATPPSPLKFYYGNEVFHPGSKAKQHHTQLSNLYEPGKGDSIDKMLLEGLGFHYITAEQQYIARGFYQRLFASEGGISNRLRRLKISFPNSAKGSLAPPNFNFTGQCGVANYTCVISLSLYGSNMKYITGAFRNIQLQPRVFPGWRVRIYYDGNSVPKDTISKLKETSAEVIPYDISGSTAGMFARFLVANDSTVDRYIIRDIDSRLSLRDKAAVDEWMHSGYSMHILRDHHAQDREINGGMWGGIKSAISNIDVLIRNFRSRGKFGDDQSFLCRVIYPLILNDHLAHDSVACTTHPFSIPFPTCRVGSEHIGMVFDELEAPRPQDTATFLLENWVSPIKCRKYPECSQG